MLFICLAPWLFDQRMNACDRSEFRPLTNARHLTLTPARPADLQKTVQQLLCAHFQAVRSSTADRQQAPRWRLHIVTPGAEAGRSWGSSDDYTEQREVGLCVLGLSEAKDLVNDFPALSVSLWP